MCLNMLPRASSSISALNLNLSFSAIALAAAGRGRNLVDQPLDVGIFRDRVVAHHERGHPRPAPQRHIGDRVGVAHHVFAAGKVVVEDRVMAMRFELVAVMGIIVVLVLRRKMLEVARACPEYGPTPVALNISQDSVCARLAGVLAGRNLPVFSAR